MSKKELQKEKAALLKWVGELEDENAIKYLSELRQMRHSFGQLRKLVAAKIKKNIKPLERKRQPITATVNCYCYLTLTNLLL